MLKEALRKMLSYVDDTSGDEREYAVIMLDALSENADLFSQQAVCRHLLGYLDDEHLGTRRAVAIALSARINIVETMPELGIGGPGLRREIQRAIKVTPCTLIRGQLIDALEKIRRDRGPER